MIFVLHTKQEQEKYVNRSDFFYYVYLFSRKRFLSCKTKYELFVLQTKSVNLLLNRSDSLILEAFENKILIKFAQSIVDKNKRKNK